MNRFIVIAALLAIIGCSRSPDVSKLSRAKIDAGSPADTAEVAWDAVGEALKSVNTEQSAAVRKLPRQWRVVYTTFLLESEVKNGGYHQFFWNSDGELNVETQADLEYIGATPFLKSFTEARKIYDAHDYAKEKMTAGNAWQGFAAGNREKRFGALDTTFYNEPKAIGDYLGEFIRSHPDLYQ